MNIGGGEAADQLVRMMLSGGEVVVRLSGSALKNMLALTMALARDHRKISGKVNLAKMLRETRDFRQFPMTPEQFRQFRRLAGKQKLLYSAIYDRDGRGKFVDVVLPVTELDRANRIFERILYGPQTERRGNEPDGKEQAGDRPFPRRDEPFREVSPPQKDSRLEQDSSDTRTSSSTPRRAPVTRTTSDRPSVEARLKGYRARLDRQKPSVPARDRAKAKPKVR